MYNQDEEMIRRAGLVWLAFFLLLTTVFIVLKLTAVILWSWWWVLAPIWGPMALGFVLQLCGIKPPGQ